MRKEVIGDATLYCADCRDVIPLLTNVDVLISDLPYGVDGGSGTVGSKSSKTKYIANFPDTPEYIENVCSVAVRMALDITKRGAITTGSRNMFKYPQPDDIGGFTHPAGTGLSYWGMVTFQPILYYGRDPRIGKTISAMTHPMNSSDRDIDHPCPKPVKEWSWLVNKASMEGETVLDIMMGSGTTGVSCARLGRKFVGIELDEAYFDVACKRIEEAYSQPDFFVTPQKKQKQQKMI